MCQVGHPDFESDVSGVNNKKLRNTDLEKDLLCTACQCLLRNSQQCTDDL